VKLSRLYGKFPLFLAPVLAISLVAQVGSAPRKPSNGDRHRRAAYLDPKAVEFIRPGVQVKIVSAAIASDGTITARVNLKDGDGNPLDRLGVNTPGPVSMSFIAAYIPAGQTQYVSYTTSVSAATITNNPSQTQAANDSGGTFTANAQGDYIYTFKTKAPSGFDATVTTAVGVSAQRDLSEFMTYDEWSETANDVFNFVPDGSPVKVTRSVVSTSACNNCHDPMIGHGGSRLQVELCILCHQPQTINADTLLTQDMKVLIHKIHMGKNLPSVKAGTPYRIWHRGQWSDFSNVSFPGGTDELMTCAVCHQNSAQADNYKTVPTRAACGSCHDDVDFASGKNHVNLPQIDDKQCAQCHIAGGTSEFDATIIGAHTVATRSKQLPGLTFAISRVDNAAPGKNPAVTFSVKNSAGNLVDISKMDFLNLVMTGPTADYNGYVSEDARTAVATGSQYVYTFQATIPAGATGSYAVGIEGYNNVTIYPNTTISQTVRDIGFNQVSYFSVDGSKVQARRKVVSQANCLNCHNTLMLHGGIRQNVEYCVVCHNPTVTDSSMRAAGDTPESVNFKTMIHKIHTGDNLTTDFTIMGHGNSVNNFNDIGYPGDRRDCTQCHVAGTYNLPLPSGLINQVAPRDYINPLPPVSGACLSCHTLQSDAAHAALQTSDTLGESCTACHGSTASDSVANVHSR
jgi:OmcA/MtrC family decaheme c-type cytochrome